MALCRRRLSEGYAFDLGDLEPRLYEGCDEYAGLLFGPLDLDFATCKSAKKFNVTHNFFALSEIDELQAHSDKEVNRAGDELELQDVGTYSSVAIANGQADAPDVWALEIDDVDGHAPVELHTWEAFQDQALSDDQCIAYLSECGTGVFDAAAKHWSDSANTTVLAQDVALRALCDAILGRSSLLFQWSPEKGSFVRPMEQIPVSGLSLACSGRFVNAMLDFGSQYRSLSELAAYVGTTELSCTALVAFKSCFASILDGIETYVTMNIDRVKSLLQLQAVVERPWQLVIILRRLMIALQTCVGDEEVISALSDEVHEILSCDKQFAAILRLMLAKVSAPWLERLTFDLRLRDGDAPIGINNFCHLNEIRPLDSSTISQARSPADWSLASFVGENDRALIQQTKLCLQLLRQHAPTQGLTSSAAMSYDMGLSAGGGLLTAREMLLEQSESFLQCSTLANDEARKASDPYYELLAEQSSTDQARPSADFSYQSLEVLDAEMSSPLTPISSRMDDLQFAVAAQMASQTPVTTNRDVIELADLHFDPLQQLRPVMQARQNDASTALLRYLFHSCQLQRHLDLQWQFHLIGNGDFAARLSEALFSLGTQPAVRKRGSRPTTGVVGLQLRGHEGQQWPPASSELQLTLMGLLSETYRDHAGKSSSPTDRTGLPNGLSFSVRELPEKDIERVLDAGSIYALDFLRLQYQPPAPLDTILTQKCMQAYDQIFRILLRLLRVLHVTTSLRQKFKTPGRSSLQRNGYVETSSLLFATEAHQFTTTLASHFMDVGIAAPWRIFCSALNSTESALRTDTFTANNAPRSLEDLRQAHEFCLETIRSSLFLRRKQERIRAGIEDVLTIILMCASALDREPKATFEVDLKHFKEALTKLLELLRLAVEKSSRSSTVDLASEEETTLVSILLARLDWNGFRSKSSPQ